MMPDNLSMTFYDFCENCKLCELAVKTNIHSDSDGWGKYKWYSISCKHLEACKRMDDRKEK